jgi:HK97 family phage major capsid protein
MTDKKTETPPVFTREAVLKLVPASEGEPSQEIELALSSEAGYERMDFWTGDRFVEVLEHSESAVDFTYARDGLPLLLDHDPTNQIGILENVRLDADKKIRGTPRFSQSQRAQEVLQDIRDGIRKKVSIGYQVKEWNKENAPRGKVPTWTAKKWMPVEGSMVAIPADYQVGVGRSAGVAAPAVIIPRDTAPKAEERTVSEESTTAATGQGAVVDYTNSRTGTTGTAGWTESEEQKAGRMAVERAKRDERMKDVASIAELHNCEGILIAGMRDGKDPDAIQREMVGEIKRRAKEGPIVGAVVELTERERKEYSLVRAINSQADGQNCFEMEVSQEIGKKLGRSPQGAGFFYPTQTRAGLYNAATVGAEVIFDEPGSFISLLRNKARTMQLGATFIGGLRETITFPEQNTAGSVGWVAENPGSDASDSNLVMTTKTLTPKTLLSTTSFSRQLLRQAVIDVEQLVRSDIAQLHALAIDLAVISGTNASNQPLGILTNTSVGVYTLGTNGGAPTYAGAIGLEFTVEDANANVGPMGYLTTPGIKATLKNTQNFTANGVPVWTGGEEGELNGYKAYSSKQVPKTLTKGTSTTVCHAIVFGVWSEFYIGEWGAMEILVDPLRLKKQGMIELTSFQMVGMMNRRPTAFAVTKDALSSY